MPEKTKMSPEEKKEIKDRVRREKALLKERKKDEAKATKLYTFRNLVREIKRVAWPSNFKSWKWFGITIAFVLIMAIFCFVITLIFTGLWNVVGIRT
ncbi:preprotein translocase subunit SecE [Mycoplasma sp. 1890]